MGQQAIRRGGFLACEFRCAGDERPQGVRESVDSSPTSSADPAVSANLAALLAAQAERAPGRIALRLGSESVNYRELAESSVRTVSVLRDRGAIPVTGLG
ncbi:hypothetical protein OG194_02835 [Streptomyces sp. NBC_01288]|uniref:hypothetical protein n=1 Tax=Streptomyces sp. NBC_01288 TaxID=2903814 RepID=UPI002E14FE0A|nr:hypothetical protein OG194_02835 [Streptomyces sp. NBC_01288]